MIKMINDTSGPDVQVMPIVTWYWKLSRLVKDDKRTMTWIIKDEPGTNWWEYSFTRPGTIAKVQSEKKRHSN